MTTMMMMMTMMMITMMMMMMMITMTMMVTMTTGTTNHIYLDLLQNTYILIVLTKLILRLK